MLYEDEVQACFVHISVNNTMGLSRFPREQHLKIWLMVIVFLK